MRRAPPPSTPPISANQHSPPARPLMIPSCQSTLLVNQPLRQSTPRQVHICDDNCAQRVYNDRYSAVCRVSRRVFVTECPGPDPCRKRACSEGGDAPADKRGPGTGAGAGAGAEGACEGDAMAA
ncbi:MAG: hypothetical protein J3K34DRAFT_7994 [Monoraphidium minutum]|nr:MAG: hypothetical protein J3K34DRAFT_7994 [Monoraphidium minutum]